MIAVIAILILCLLMYVLLDGYDLGVGIISLFTRSKKRSRDMLEMIATVWDGNESWLVLLAVGTWASLPGFFGVFLPFAYLPLAFMLFGLILRGVSLEMVSRSAHTPTVWLRLFGAGSLLAAVSQGVALGALTQTVTMTDGAFSGGATDVFGMFTFISAVGLVLVYVSLGTAYLRLKSAGDLRASAVRWGRPVLTVSFVVAVLWVLNVQGTPGALAGTGSALIAPVVLIAIAALAWMYAIWAIDKAPRHDPDPDRQDWSAMIALGIAIVAAALAYVVGRYPALLPNMTIADAQSPEGTFTFIMIGIGLNIPLVLFYNWYSHRVFRGKYRSADLDERPPGVSASAAALRTSEGNGQ